MKELLIKSIKRLESAKATLKQATPIVREEGSREDNLDFAIGYEIQHIDNLISEIRLLLGALAHTRD